MIEHKQYTFTTNQSLKVEQNKNKEGLTKLSILIKDGITIVKSQEERVNEQFKEKNSANSGRLITLPLTYHSIDLQIENLKLDDDIRKWLYENNINWQASYTSSGTEWSVYFIPEDIIKKYNIKEHDKMDKNNSFLNDISKSIIKDKKNAIKNLTSQKAYKTLKLRPYQQQVLNEMLISEKDYFLLSLAPRFGKTLMCLEYIRELKKKEKINDLTLLVLSKNLSSNTSFLNDYKDYGFNNIFHMKDVSLFKAEENVLTTIKNIKGNVILITDEGDMASHTEKSRDKLKKVKKHLKTRLIKQIVMSGTGIYKANKIFEDIKKTEVCDISMNYTQMRETDKSTTVLRKHIDVVYEMEDKTLNIQDSFQHTKHHKNISKCLLEFVEENQDLNIDESNVTMCFINTKYNKDLENFSGNFQKENPEYKTICITSGEDYSNELAEKKVNNIIKKNSDKKIIIFSRQMSSRSFSVPDITKVIIMADSEITNHQYQAMSRSLTFKKDKKTVDIIRISFSEFALKNDIFLLENKDFYNKTLKDREKSIFFFYEHNTFQQVKYKNHFPTNARDESQAQFLDSLIKHLTKIHIIANTFDLDVKYEEAGDKTAKKATQSTNVDKPSKKEKKIKDEFMENIAKEDTARLYYAKIIRCIPTVCKKCYGISTFKELERKISDDMIIEMKMTPEIFRHNLKNRSMITVLESLFNSNISEKEMEEILIEYMEIINA